jgi:hypothetical protein
MLPVLYHVLTAIDDASSYVAGLLKIEKVKIVNLEHFVKRLSVRRYIICLSQPRSSHLPRLV